jgi:hypothetical protein
MKKQNIWLVYEQEKRRIEKQARSSEEYEKLIKQLCDRLKI